MSASPAVRDRPNGAGYCPNKKSENFLHPKCLYGQGQGLKVYKLQISIHSLTISYYVKGPTKTISSPLLNFPTEV